MPNWLSEWSRVKMLLFKEQFVSIHSSLSGQTHDCNKNSAAEYKSCSEGWQGAPRVSISSHSVRPQTPPFHHLCFNRLSSMLLSFPGQRQVTKLDSEWKHMKTTRTVPPLN